MSELLLELKNIETSYGPISAVRGISLKVNRGQIVTLLGANGAGKSTVLKTISGVLDPKKGQVIYKGVEIQGKDPDKIARLGIAHVPEGREVFPFLSVLDNLKIGAWGQPASTLNEQIAMCYAYFPRLKERENSQARLLSGGEQQMLAIARALMSKPDVMLMDEPSLGLSPKLASEVFTIVKRLNVEQGLTVLLVEQSAKAALNTAHFGYVIEIGRIVMEDTTEELLKKEDIQEFYLGLKEQGVRGQRRWKKRRTWR
jgi:branched-chain amino acid transport system ATP-binding protein